MYEHIAVYNTFAIGFYFYNTNSVISNTDSIIAIGLFFPYRGATIRNVGINTPFNYINYCYGESDNIFQGSDFVIYNYYSIGVDFLRYDSRVGLILVYAPFSTKSYTLCNSTGTQTLLHTYTK